MKHPFLVKFFLSCKKSLTSFSFVNVVQNLASKLYQGMMRNLGSMRKKSEHVWVVLITWLYFYKYKNVEAMTSKRMNKLSLKNIFILLVDFRTGGQPDDPTPYGGPAEIALRL